MKKFLKIWLLVILSILIVWFLYYFFIAKAPEPKKITWGVNFSQMQAEALGLDWKKMYLAILEDLKAKDIKLLTQWDWIEGKEDTFYFKDVDWQLQQAQNHNARIVYVVGMKTGRWPECHVPSWANDLSKEQQQTKILEYIQEVVLRYRDSSAVVAWQAENEPLFVFGKCPWYDKDFLVKEVSLIKSLDSTRPVMVSDSGEQSLWWGAAQIGDVVGVTMYRRAWFHISDWFGFYMNFPIPPVYYWRKVQLVQALFHKKVIGVELQAEPWNSRLFYDVPLEEQEKSMNLEQFKENIQYAKKTGISEFYLWGTEWHYWLKEKQHQPEIWNEAKKLFQ